MTDRTPAWLADIKGQTPRFRWLFAPEASLTDFQLAKESGELLVADGSGGLSRLSRTGKLISVTRTGHQLTQLVFSDTGEDGAALLGNNKLGWFDRNLQFRWTKSLADTPLCLGMTAFGSHAAVCLANGENLIFAADQKKVGQFEATRPIKHLQFLQSSPEFLAAAEYGLLARFQFPRTAVWTETLWSTIGSMAATGDGKVIYLAGFVHGVQVYDGNGQSKGVFAMDGTVGLVATSYKRNTLLAATLEGQLLCLNAEGEVKWSVHVPEPLQKIVVSPYGDFVLIGFQSGAIVRLDQEP